METLGFSLHISWHLQIVTSFTSNLPIWIPLVSFLIIVAGPSNTMLNRSGKSGHPCVVPELRRKAFSFSLCWLWVCCKWLSLCSFYTHFGENFYQEWMFNFVKCFFCICWDDYVVFVFPFVNVLYHVVEFILLIFLRIFTSVFVKDTGL